MAPFNIWDVEPFSVWRRALQSPYQKWHIGTCALHTLCLAPIITLNIRAQEIRPGLELRLTSILLSAAFAILTWTCGAMSGTILPQQGILLMHGVLAVVSAIPAIILFVSLFKEGDAHQWDLTWWYFATVTMPVPLSCLATVVTSVYLMIEDGHSIKISTKTDISDADGPLRHEDAPISDVSLCPEISPSDGPMRRLYLDQIRGDTSDQALSNTTSHQNEGSWPLPYLWGIDTGWAREEEELPAGFEMYNTPDGGRYFTLDADTKPIWRDLRFRTGWTRFSDPKTGRTCYVDHNNRYMTWLKPAAPYLKGFEDDIFREWEKIWIRRANRFFFVNHRTGETTWKDPQRKDNKKADFVDKSGDLPPGWQTYPSSEGGHRYFCHNTGTWTWFDPRDSLPPLDSRWLQELHHNCNCCGASTIGYLDIQTGEWTFKDPRRPGGCPQISEARRSTESSSRSSVYNEVGFKQRYLAARYSRLYALLSAILLFAQGGLAVTLALRLRLNTGVDWLIFVPWMPVITGTVDLGVTLTTLWFFFYFGPPTVDAITNHLNCLAWIATSAAMAVPVAVQVVSTDNLGPRDVAREDAEEYLRVTGEVIKWLLVMSCLSTLTMALWIGHGYAFGRFRR